MSKFISVSVRAWKDKDHKGKQDTGNKVDQELQR